MLRTDAFGTADGCAPQAYIRESRRIDALTRIVQRDIDAGAFRRVRSARAVRDSCGIGWYGIDVHPASGPGSPGRFCTLRFQIPSARCCPKRSTISSRRARTSGPPI